MDIEQIKPFFTWIQQHPHLSGLIVCFISMIESIAILGLIIPGSVTMTAIGTLMGSGILPIYETLLWAILGAILGDNASYWLGYHYHEQIRNLWPLNRYKNLLQSGEDFFHRHGGKSVFLGRFVGPVRPIIPVVAGMLNMEPMRFMVANILSAIGWAPAYMLPGILIGAASTELAPETATRFLLLIFAILLAIWCLWWLIKKLCLQLIFYLDRGIQHLWSKVSHFHALNRILHDKQTSNPDHTQFSLALFTFIILLAFLALTIAVKLKALANLNTPTFHLMRSLYNIPTQKFMLGVTFLGDSNVLWTAATLIGLWLAFKRHWHVLSHWLALAIATNISTEGIKHWLNVPRPGLLLHNLNGGSFPSGHVSASTAFYGFLAVLIATNLKASNRWVIYVIATSIIFMISLSRLYLSAHWLSDVVGGLLVGLSLILLTTLSYRRKEIAPLSWLNLFLIAGLSVSITWACFTLNNFSQAIYSYTPYWPAKTFDSHTWWQGKCIEPLYRKNRAGKPVQILNVEWAGDLLTIKNELEEEGWYLLPKATVTESIKRLLGNPKEHAIYPMLSQLYEDKKPLLVMGKVIDNKLLILRLWDSKTTLKGYFNAPLWVGTIGYYRPWNFKFLTQMQTDDPSNHPLPSPTRILKGDIQDFVWKQINMSNLPPLITRDNADWEGFILMLRPDSD